MRDLSILIPARNEEFLSRTIEDILSNIRGDTEVIAVLDGEWADPPIPQNDRVTILYNPVSVGQRAATNQAARISTARFVMKADAHCAFDEGFDIKLMADCEQDWTVIPRMYNLHVFDWVCSDCGARTYQGPKPPECEVCKSENVEREMVWEPRRNRRTDFARFDASLHFQYWRDYERRPEAKGDIVDVMACVGACWFMHRSRYWEIGGMDEAHGSWGQMGVEVACKSWLSGGRQVVNKKTWFAHLFRTQKGFGFPYPQSGKAVQAAREHSRRLWQGDNWDKAIHSFSWLLEKFAPIPGWDVDKGIIYYTDNRLDETIAAACRQHLASHDLPIVSASLAPLDFGENIVIEERRGILTMFKQILAALEASEAEIVYFCEHDLIYHPTHFEFIPPTDDAFYYNENTVKVNAEDGLALFYYTKQTSGLVCYRRLAIEHYRKRVERVEAEGKYNYRIGFEPGCHRYPRGIDDYPAKRFMSEFPNIDIRHGSNLTKSRWSRSEFRSQRSCRGWDKPEIIAGWGRTKGRFNEFLKEATSVRQ